MRSHRTPIQLSPEFEEAFFHHRLTKKEISNLHTRSESYQKAAPPAWDALVFPAYSQYFGFLSALKTRSSLLELEQYGLLDPKTIEHFIDIGAGTLGSSLGALDYFKEREHSLKTHTIVDEDFSPAEWSLRFFKKMMQGLKTERKTLKEVDLSASNSLFFIVDTWNEMQDFMKEEFFKRSENLGENSFIVIIDPANKTTNRSLLSWRDRWAALQTGNAHLLLPCTHLLPCPSLKEHGDWCHEERNYRAPSPYWNIVQELGFNRDWLQYSLLVLGSRKSPFTDQQARMVSRRLKSKGKEERWFCGEGKKWKAVDLKRFKKDPEHQAFFEIERGEIVDISSLPRPRRDVPK